MMWFVIIVAALLLFTGALALLLDSRKKREERKYYEAAYRILKEEYLNQAIKKDKAGYDCEIGEMRTMLYLALQGKRRGMENAYVFDPVLPVTIGRNPEENRLCLKDGAISGRHCRIQLIRGELWLTDEGSSNGTLVCRGRKEYWTGDRNSMRLQTDDLLLMGQMRLRVRIFYFDTMYL